MFSSLVPNNATALEALQFIYENKLNTAVTNFAVALRIVLTIPVTVASGERSFSKLKLIKNYLRTSMTQERLNHLALLSIEHDVAQSLDYRQFIREFVAQKAAKLTSSHKDVHKMFSMVSLRLAMLLPKYAEMRKSGAKITKRKMEK